MSGCINHAVIRGGRVVAICRFCGTRSPGTKPNDQGEPDLWAMPRNWSEAPFPTDCEHRDGSRGSLYSCPACNKRLQAGEALQRRSQPEADITAGVVRDRTMTDVLDHAAARAAARRFTGAPITGFGALA